MTTRILEIKQITEDKELYPRINYGWHTAYQYSQAMKSGSIFPDIVVAELDGNFVLVDGKHRLEAKKSLKETSIQCEILKGLNRKQLFLEAIKRNVQNARPFSPQEKAKIAVKLRAMKFTDQQISGIICVPFDKLEKFVLDRVTDSITGEEVILKAPLKHLHGQTVSVEIVDGQMILSATNQLQIINQAIMLLQTNSMKRNNVIRNKLKVLRKEIEKFIKKK